MCENPNNTDAVHQPAQSLFDARESMFCSSPRNKNSSGHAVRNKMAIAVKGTVLHAPLCGANEIKCNTYPSWIAMHANPQKPAMTKNPHLAPHPIVYPIPLTRLVSTNAAMATFSASNTVNAYASRESGYGHTQCDGPNFTATHTPANTTKSCQAPAAARSADAARASGANTKSATAPTRETA